MKCTESTCQKTILLAEDESQIRNMLYDLMIRHGYKVIQAVDGLDALEKFKQNPHGICLLVTDIIMPRMDGVTSFKEMSNINPSVKVLFMSGYISGQLHPEAKTLMKPFSPIEILQAVDSILNS